MFGATGFEPATLILRVERKQYGSHAVFPLECLPPLFQEQLEHCCCQFKEYQEVTIKENLHLWDQIQDEDSSLLDYLKDECVKFFQKYNINYLETNKRIIKDSRPNVCGVPIKHERIDSKQWVTAGTTLRNVWSSKFCQQPLLNLFHRLKVHVQLFTLNTRSARHIQKIDELTSRHHGSQYTMARHDQAC
ncbi:uncharacterized protein LOC143242591 isoform X1 [Tachypleus tridentatus]|uniref:uncharacterized protein LOC143242591 isoform X1 n=1 Tax=Tachypleus tridentatus TaxID=6853 RepID=UPI003FD33BAA